MAEEVIHSGAFLQNCDDLVSPVEQALPFV
jgi:hypothetical protein